MSGTAVETGDPTNVFDVTLGILNALTGGAVEPREPTPTAPPPAPVGFQIGGLGIGTLALLAIGAIVLIKLVK